MEVKGTTVAATPLFVKNEYGEEGFEGGLRRLGRSSAEYGLKKVYRAFLRLGPPRLIVQRAGLIFGTFYRPGMGVVAHKESERVVIRFEGFPEKTGLVEIRIAGWMERALEITGGKNPGVNITKSVSRGDQYIELVCTWE